MKELFKEVEKDLPDNYSFKCDFLFNFNKNRLNKQEINANWRQFFELTNKLELEDIDELIDNQGLTLVHGDFHKGNLLINYNKKFRDNDYVILDWEFATRGSFYLDLAYLNVFSNCEIPKRFEENISPWKKIATTMITHWYLVNDPTNSFTEVWLRKLRTILD